MTELPNAMNEADRRHLLSARRGRITVLHLDAGRRGTLQRAAGAPAVAGHRIHVDLAWARSCFLPQRFGVPDDRIKVDHVGRRPAQGWQRSQVRCLALPVHRLRVFFLVLLGDGQSLLTAVVLLLKTTNFCQRNQKLHPGQYPSYGKYVTKEL